MGITREAISLLFLLVPGFISSVIFRCAVRDTKKDLILHLFEVLTFSLFIFVAVNSTIGWESIIQIETRDSGVFVRFSGSIKAAAVTFGYAVILGVLLIAIVEKDIHMRLLRYLKFTDASSRSTSWDAAFADQKRFVTVLLKDGRRISGYPLYYTKSDINSRYLYIYKHAWVTDDNECIESCAHGILIKESKIEFIEFQLETSETQEKS